MNIGGWLCAPLSLPQYPSAGILGALLSSSNAPKMAQFMASRFRKFNSSAAQRTLLGFAVSAPSCNLRRNND